MNDIDNLLRIWGSWRKNCFLGLGFPTRSTIYKPTFTANASYHKSVGIKNNRVAESIDILCNEYFNSSLNQQKRDIVKDYYVNNDKMREIVRNRNIKYSDVKNAIDSVKQYIDKNL